MLCSFQSTNGGDEEDRTPDPLRARQVLSQLSYTPMSFSTYFIIHFVSNFVNTFFKSFFKEPSKLNNDWNFLSELTWIQALLLFSIERRWSSRTFRYGYLVTTSPQSLASPSTAPSLLLGHRLRVLPTPMVWRAVCTRPGNVFTATFWFAITSDSSFM